MEKYRPKTPLASAADHLLRVFIAVAAGVGWFVSLWGLSLPSLCAGVAMGGLFWLCVRLFGKKSVQKKEALMRRMLGGEIALDKLLLLPPRHAAFQAALWLAPKAPVEMRKALPWGVLGQLKGKSTYIRLIAQHKSLEVNAQQVVEVVREMEEHHAQRCFLCLTAPLSREAAAYADNSEIRVVSREEMTALAGSCSPATDEELCSLKRKKRKRRTLAQWAAIVFNAGRARRYFWYGLGLTALAVFTRQGFYPIPAALCLLLFAGCKIYQQKAGREQW